MHAPEDTVKLIIAESERLTQYLTTLPPKAWRTSSACERWEVRDVVAHLAMETEGYTDVIARSVQGDASPPAGRQWSAPPRRRPSQKTPRGACSPDGSTWETMSSPISSPRPPS